MHTPEPWYSINNHVSTEKAGADAFPKGKIIANLGTSNIAESVKGNIENAQRIVACVNAFGLIKEEFPTLYDNPEKLLEFIKAADACALSLPFILDRKKGTAMCFMGRDQFQDYIKSRGKIPDPPPPKPKILYRCGSCGAPVRKDGGQIPELKTYKDFDQYIKSRGDLETKKVDGFCCPGEVGT